MERGKSFDDHGGGPYLETGFRGQGSHFLTLVFVGR